MLKRRLDRRGFIAGSASFCGALSVGGCDKIQQSAAGQRGLQAGEDATKFVQRLLLSETRLAQEFAEDQMSTAFKANGSTDPQDKDYRAHIRDKFYNYRLQVDGLVEKSLKLSLPDLRKIPSRTQITRHDCVEGWSCIGKWTGAPLRDVLLQAGLKPEARFIVFHCFDTMEGADSDDNSDPSGDSQSGNMQTSKSGSLSATPVKYYESIDLTDAFHPQTILAYDMNGQALPIDHGAPLRVRIERQLGYKMAKYISRIEVVVSYSQCGDGRGGYWEDRGYDWYAGI